MVENKIKEFAEQRNMSIRQLILSIGMTDSGYYAMLRNNSMKLDTLQKISEVLSVPMALFFTDANTDEGKALLKDASTQVLGKKKKRGDSSPTTENELKNNNKLLRALKKKDKALADAQNRIDALIAQNAQLTGIVAK